MRLRFTKMQGAGNDFVVLDATRAAAVPEHGAVARLADRRFGVGADQILVVERAPHAGRRFRLPHLQRRQRRRGRALRQRRALLRAFRARAGADRQALRPRADRQPRRSNCAGPTTARRHGRHGPRPTSRSPASPFDAEGLVPRRRRRGLWPLGDRTGQRGRRAVDGQPARGARVVDRRRPRRSAALGPAIESDRAFRTASTSASCRCVARGAIRLRVFERGAGETLACGTRRLRGGGRRHPARLARRRRVDVAARGGRAYHRLARRRRRRSRSPARPTTVFQGEIEL